MRVLDGACRLPDGTLAGSVLTMEKALANLIVATDTDLATCWASLQFNRRRLLWLGTPTGAPTAGVLG